MLDKAYRCGVNTVGLDEVGVCSVLNYERVIYIESLSCRELANLLSTEVKSK
jgi:hypothetical protein